MKVRFQDNVMQDYYERLIKDGWHWKSADKRTRDTYEEYDEGLNEN